jgi:hypothetical protein
MGNCTYFLRFSSRLGKQRGFLDHNRELAEAGRFEALADIHARQERRAPSEGLTLCCMRPFVPRNITTG